MNTIESQIEALTQELRPYPKGQIFHYFISSENYIGTYKLPVAAPDTYESPLWYYADKTSTNKVEVEEYADCYRRLKLYQLLGKKAEKEFPIDWSDTEEHKFGTDWIMSLAVAEKIQMNHLNGSVRPPYRRVVLGGVWFKREIDRLEALKICGIDAEFQKRCAKYGLGGA